MGYRRLQEVTGGYKGSQGVPDATGGYKGLEGGTRGYRVLQGVPGDYKGLQGVTRGYRGVKRGYKGLQGVTTGLQGVTGVTRGYRGLQQGNREQGWRSGESTRLPPMWPGFDSRTRRHMLVEFVVGSLLCSERFSPPVFPSAQKPTFLNSNSIRNARAFNT